jgi:hypothetical protein
LPLLIRKFIASCRRHPCHPFSWGLECLRSSHIALFHARLTVNTT